MAFSLQLLYAFSYFCCSCILQSVTFHTSTVLMHLSSVMLLTHSPCFTPLTHLSSSTCFTVGRITQCSCILGCESVNVHVFFDFHTLHLSTLWFLMDFTLPTCFTRAQCFSTLALPLSTCGVKLLTIVLRTLFVLTHCLFE